MSIPIPSSARNLWERLSDEHQPTAESLSNATTRLDAWRQAVAPGDPANFEKRLAWDGINLEQATRAVSSASLPDSPPPAWLSTLEAAFTVARESAAAPPDHRAFNPDKPAPFQELLIPFVVVAARQLTHRAGPAYNLISDSAHATLERSLLSRLNQFCLPTLQLNFSIYRTLHAGESNLYKTFIHDHLADGLDSFFRDYAALARLCATATDFWIDWLAEFLDRFRIDLPLLQSTFNLPLVPPSPNPQQPSPIVTAVTASISDPHRNGRGVIILSFGADSKVVYKPRSLGLDHAFSKLLEWINSHNDLLSIKALTVLDRDTHGWMEFATHEPCQTERDAHDYYERAGYLLALSYVLYGADLHHENIIAHGAQPALVDLEMIFQASPREAYEVPLLKPDPDTVTLRRRLDTSVMRSGLLPTWDVAPGGAAFDWSGLGAVLETQSVFRQPKWKNINSDEMAVESDFPTVKPIDNVPRLSDRTLDPNDYVDDLLTGFTRLYRFLQTQRAEVPLHLFETQTVRYLFRATRIYFMLLQKSVGPRLLHDGADRSIQLDAVTRLVLRYEQVPQVWPLIRAEALAMEQGDIPYFSAKVNSTAVDLHNGHFIENFFDKSGWDLVQERLQALDDADLALQTEIIRSTFYTRITGPTRAEAAAPSSAGAVPIPVSFSHDSASLITLAATLADQIDRRAIRSGQAITWFSLNLLHSAQHYTYQSLDYDLYSGTVGIAFFCGALARLTGERRYRDLAVQTVQDLRSSMQEAKPIKSPAIILGGAAGIGAYIYCLTHLSQFLDEPALLDDSRRATQLIIPEQIALDKDLDILGGSAGAILGLLKLYEVGGDTFALETAVRCGQHLLNQRVESNTGLRAWATLPSWVLPGTLLTGFAHGAAGIAYALLRLAHASGDSTFREAASEAIAYETSVFDSEQQNWPDFRRWTTDADAKPTFMTSWCHGAPGIGLARLGGLPVLDTPQIRADIEVAVNKAGHGLHTTDHLCCGNFGRAEILLAAGQRLNRPDLITLAHQQAAAALSRAGESHAFSFFAGLPAGTYHPGFFQGTAGIGYQLLRLARPDHLPSVLLWE